MIYCNVNMNNSEKLFIVENIKINIKVNQSVDINYCISFINIL